MEKRLFYLISGWLLVPLWTLSVQEKEITYSFRETLPLQGKVKSVGYSNGNKFEFDERGKLAVPYVYEVSSLLFPDEYTMEMSNKGED